MKNNENINMKEATEAMSEAMLNSGILEPESEMFKRISNQHYGMTVPCNTISIPLMQYKTFVRVVEYYNNLKRAVLQSCELGYGCDELRMDDTALNTLLKVLEPEAYEERLRELKEERATKRRESEE